jgi:hypothetical protein
MTTQTFSHERVPRRTMLNRLILFSKGSAKALLLIGKGMLQLLLPRGTNFAGFMILAIVIFGLGALHDPEDQVTKGILFSVGGLIILTVDLVYRRRVLGVTLLEYRRCPYFLLLPLWVWGLLWVLGGLSITFHPEGSTVPRELRHRDPNLFSPRKD